MKKQVKYQFYATLLNAFADFQKSDDIYEEYWGNSENPSITVDEFRQRQFHGLIDKINRVPMKWEDCEKADRGTAFNEIVDCLIQNCSSDKMQIKSDRERQSIQATYNERTFEFPISICREFSDYFKNAQCQVYTEGKLVTVYGNVKLYGYIDELMPMSVHDIKTAGNYSMPKFKHQWQHIVYPFCLACNGININDFEYNILTISEKSNGNTYETFTESYCYNPQVDVLRLTGFCEQFIEFLERNKELITDKKIFNNNEL